MDATRVAAKIVVTDKQSAALQRWARGRSTPVRLIQRVQMILLAADGKQNKEIADTLDVQASTVGRWRQRFAARGLAGIEKDASRGGRKPTKQRHWAQRIVETTLHKTPPNATHRSVRTLAKHLGIHRAAFHSIRHLIDTITDHTEHHNDNPKTFVWTARADDILEKVAHAWDTLNVTSGQNTTL